MMEEDSGMNPPDLRPGEWVVWNGLPYRGFLVRKINYQEFRFLIILGLAWLFSIYLILSQSLKYAHEHPMPIGSFLDRECVLLLCASLSFSPPLPYHFREDIRDFRKRKKTRYFLTEERIIAVWGPGEQDRRSENIHGICDVKLDRHSGGRGTVTVGGVALEGIEDADIVCNKIAALREARESRTGFEDRR
ncbi:MAG: hypothetical protein JW929_05955 [Anaerolineales bacterium]|nr:hypothetical protein [Anaerolineales bacterium]